MQESTGDLYSNKSGTKSKIDLDKQFSHSAL